MQWQNRKRLGFLLTALTILAAPAAAQDALVLGGGGARGLAHAGSLQALSEKGFRPDLVVGSSMGSIIGALHAAGLDADSIWRISRAMDWQELFSYSRFRTLPDGEASRPFLNLGVGVDRRRYVEGLMTDWRVNRLLMRLLFDAAARAHGDFDRLPIRYRAVAGDLKTGEPVSIGSGDLALAVRASMAVPGLFAPVIDEQGRYLVDGGISDYLPVQAARDAGARHIVAIDVIDPPADRMGRLNPMQIALRSFRLTLRNAR
ncbi:MAG: patatin-like phospholipase family protein, partial [Gemmatimonadota bacterium]